jgi:hypothetical protein
MRAELLTIALLFCVNASVSAGEAAGQPDDPQIAKPKTPPAGHRWEECKLVNQWWTEGTGAGNVGDWYDNRDGDHSPLRVAKYFPQMKKVAYSAEDKKRRRGWGAQLKFLPQVTIGNSSTSARPERGGSNPRRCYSSSRYLTMLHNQYRNNNLYVYPEHRDYDPGHNQRVGFGDLFPTNTPYLIISQGSSGSDQAFLRALAHTLAAFNPKVKKKLIDEKLLMPTLQQIFRSSYKTVEKPEDYLTGKTHPTVFNGKMINAVKMVNAAHQMTIATIPPMIQLEVIKETFNIAGRGTRSEKLADTPAVIARIHRTPEYKKMITVSARKSFDLNKKPIKYHWSVLRGDGGEIEIKTRDGGATAEILIPYHDRRSIAPGSAMEGTRVDIGVFVHNGTSYSAPGFVTIFYLDTEARTYNQKGHLLDIYRAAGDTVIGKPTSNSSDLINNKYDIFDWPLLFDSLKKNSKGFAFELLKKQLKPAELAVIAKAAKAFKPEEIAKLKAKGKLSKEQRKEQHKIRQTMTKALTAIDPALKLSAKNLAEQALNAIRKDHNLYFNNTKIIEALAAALSTQKAKDSFLAAKNKIAAIGVFKNGKLKSIFPSQKELTKYEAYQVELLNLSIISQVFFPGFVNFTGSKNYVDRRMGASRPWRDVYRCDNSSRILGWTRFDESKPGKYTLKEKH